MLNIQQFRTEILRPTLQHLGSEYASLSAENLLLGTAAQESGFRHVKQLNGPAMGLFQMEPATLKDLYENWLKYREPLRVRLDALLGVWPDRERALQGNLYYACATARLQYARDPSPLPGPGDVDGMGQLWKRVWNTHLGRGTVPQFTLNYREFVEGR